LRQKRIWRRIDHRLQEGKKVWTPAEREAWQRVLRAEYGERPASTWPAMPYMLQGLESFSRQPAAPAVTAQPAPSASGNPAAASQAASATGGGGD